MVVDYNQYNNRNKEAMNCWYNTKFYGHFLPVQKKF